VFLWKKSVKHVTFFFQNLGTLWWKKNGLTTISCGLEKSDENPPAGDGKIMGKVYISTIDFLPFN